MGISVKQTLKASTVGSLETDSCFHSQLIFYNSSKNTHQEETRSLIGDVGEAKYLYVKD